MGRTKKFEPDIVLKHALELFWRKGYEPTSLQDLVDHLGISGASLYATFGNKHELCLKAMQRYREDDELVRRLSQPGSAVEAIRALLNDLVEVSLADAEFGADRSVRLELPPHARSPRARPASPPPNPRPPCRRPSPAPPAFSNSTSNRHSGRTAPHGINLHYVIGGQGDPLFLLGRWPQTWWKFHKVMPALARLALSPRVRSVCWSPPRTVRRQQEACC
ncbi:TetR/AcrR family transcriptional regulator [Streptomyces sp. NPDC056144]|uniref:TetR/AcrR family transcriptional regulator n=1 Tax=unclassified Streptomyces TaxID=2593676 RepID=UPI0035E2B052